MGGYARGKDDLRVEGIVDRAAFLRPAPTVRDAEVQPLVRLHLGTRLARTYPEELSQQRGQIDRYPSNILQDQPDAPKVCGPD